MRKLAAIALVLAGCGGSAEAPSSIASAEDSAPADTEDSNVEETASPAYPSGPYGTAVGDVVADLELVGYVREETSGLATDSTYGAATLGDLRARATVKYAVLHVGGFT